MTTWSTCIALPRMMAAPDLVSSACPPRLFAPYSPLKTRSFKCVSTQTTHLLLLLRVLNRQRLVGVAKEMLAVLRAGLSRVPADTQYQNKNENNCSNVVNWEMGEWNQPTSVCS